jgi:hypothetical protein
LVSKKGRKMAKYSLIMNEKHDGITREVFDEYVNHYMQFLANGNAYGGKYRLVCNCKKHTGVMVDVERSKDLFELYFNTTQKEQDALICARLENARKEAVNV